MPNSIVSSIINSMPPWATGVVMAVIMSVLRVVYEKEETTLARIGLEALICGGLTIAAGSLLEAMNLGEKWYLGAGVLIGFMGSQTVKATVNKLINKKVK
jgi:lambda family phage holin